MMQSWMWDGIQECWAATVGLALDDRGFRYGLHCFETMRVTSGRVREWGAHLALLGEAARGLGWTSDLPPIAPCTPPVAGEGVLRIYWTGGQGGPGGGPGSGSFLAAFEPGDAPAAPSAFRTITVPEPLPRQWAAWKTGAYGDRVARLWAVQAAGVEEGLLLFPDGMLSGWCMGNVAVRRAGEWWTPDDPAIRRGTMIAWLERTGRVRRGSMHGGMLAEAEGLLFCNALRGVVPVTELDGRRFPVWPEAAQWQRAWAAEAGE